MLIVVTFFLLSIGIAWVITRYFYSRKEHMPRASKLMAFLLDEKITEHAVNLIFTVVGVILALWLTNVDTEKTKSSDSGKILSALRSECSQVEDNILQYYIPWITRMRENGNNDQYVLSEYLEQPLYYVTTFDNALSSELVITNIHQDIYTSLVDCNRSSMESFYSLDRVKSVDRLVFELETISENMKFCQDVIDIELDHSLNDAKVKDLLEQRYRQYLRETPLPETSGHP